MSAEGKPVVLTMVGHYLPGFKAGGIISCVANIVNHFKSEFKFLIVTRDRDLGDSEAYPNIEEHAWQTIGNASVYYLPPGADSMSQLRRIVRQTPHDVIYLNSFFDPLTIKLLLNRKFGFIDRKPIVLCPQGEFAWPSLRQKYLKKVLFMRMVRVIGLYAPVTWHASSTVEAEDIVKVMRVPASSICMASQLPPVIEEVTDDSSIEMAARNEVGLRVVFLSRISPEKNLGFALKVLSQVRTKVAFDIIGPIEKADYWNECQHLFRELPAHVTARSLGPIRSSEVIKTLSQYDLMLFPSRSESYGQVIAESLTCGTQVLISTNTPWRDLESKGLGWDFPLDDIRPFVRIVDELGSSSEASRAQRRRAVRKNVGQFLSESSALADIRQLFMTVIARAANLDVACADEVGQQAS